MPLKLSLKASLLIATKINLSKNNFISFSESLSSWQNCFNQISEFFNSDLIKSILGREEKLNLHYRSESRQDKTSVLAQDLVKEINSIYKKDKDLYEKYYNKTQWRN